jgi:uncharacterized protein YuzE
MSLSEAFMRIEYDPAYNVAYIRLIEDGAKDLQTIAVSDELNVDMTADGRIYGIELLNATDRLFGQHPGELIVENRQTGRTEKIALP